MVSSRRGQAVQGTGLAFIVYTEAIKNMEVSQLWSALYFFMLLMLGVGSMLGNTAAILTPLTDSKVISSHLPKEAISGERAGPGRGWASGREACRGTWVGGLPRGAVLPEVATGAVATSQRSRPHLLLASGSRGPAQVSLVLHTMGK